MSTHDEHDEMASPTIVVGVDGSDQGDAALRWAMRKAAQWHGTVRAVRVCQQRHLLPATSLAALPHGSAPTTSHEACATELHAAVEAATTAAKPAQPPKVIEHTIVGDPITELSNQAADADMLVVGSSGKGPIVEVFLGSVAGGVLRHADCPVVVLNSKAAAHETSRTDD